MEKSSCSHIYNVSILWSFVLIFYCCFRHRCHCYIDCFDYDSSSEYDPLLLFVVSLTRLSLQIIYDLVYCVTKEKCFNFYNFMFPAGGNGTHHMEKGLKAIFPHKGPHRDLNWMSQLLWLILLTWSWMMLMIQRWTTRYHPTQVQLEILSFSFFIVCHNYNATFVGIKLYIMH